MTKLISTCVVLVFASALSAVEPVHYEYRLLATNRTSTMEKEMNQAAEAGFCFKTVMGGDTAFGGKQVVVIMGKPASPESAARKQYKLLATNRTSTMQKEMQEAADQGFRYCGQTVFESAFGGKEVSVILERDSGAAQKRATYRLLATSKTSTMEKELQEAGAQGFHLIGMTVGGTALGGSEVVSILVREEE